MHASQDCGMILQAGSELPDTFDATHASMILKRLLLHQLKPAVSDMEMHSMSDVLRACGQDSSMPWLLATAISKCKVIQTSASFKQGVNEMLLTCRGLASVFTSMPCKQGMLFGIGEMRGVGLLHIHGMGFLMSRIPGEDGLPVWSGPSYIEIASARAGVGAGAEAVPRGPFLDTTSSRKTCVEERYLVGQGD
jgi:hypothetical protein